MYIHKNMHLIYKQDFYRDKKRKYMNFLLDTFSPSCTILIILSLLNNGKNLDAAAYEKNLNQDVKILSIKKKIIAMKKLKTGQQA